MGYYHNILNLLSLVLVLAILFIVIYGCQFKKYRRIERFTDKDFKKEELIKDYEENESEETEDFSKMKKTQKEDKEDDKEDDNEEISKKEVLEGFEGEILSGLTKGTITSSDMDKFINAGTFTKKNLENIISYVEKFKNQFS
jgi:hypothetical protein